MNFKYKALLTIAPAIFILDQLTKWLVVKNIQLYTAVPVIPGYFDLVHYKNPGAAFGMLANLGESFRQPFFYAVTVVAMVIFVIFFVKLPKQARILPVAISLVFGGIAGNILDRIRFGMVTDFLSFHIQDKVWDWNVGSWHVHVPLNWPAFNVADSAITIAMFLLVISVFKTERGEYETDTF